ncbi:MAG: glycoside hydrolase family 3 N-terminal domain-containing protein [Candidatus Azambacteria bacterium]|nr:glycoside hydrolase family 3 N-terminal domain-containing protein [Candidatus Azambacteria bacterium]
MFKNILVITLFIVVAGSAMFYYQLANLKSPIDDPIKLKISKMSLDEKIGQLVIVGFENKYVDGHIEKMIKQYHVGGVNLLGRNAESQSQVKKLISDLQSMSQIPLFIAIDQEGGAMVRFKFLSELTPQSKITSTTQAKNIAFERAQELKELGVNMNFSPVMDYVSDKDSYLYHRTFGTNPDNIGELGDAMIKGYIKGGIVPVAKHFPGYGNVLSDPHNNKALLIANKETFDFNLVPFKKILIDSQIPAIMTAHIIIPFISQKPSTLSSEMLSGILRKQFQFKGVIITDDLEMVSVGGSIEQVAVDSINAGADMLISTLTPEKQDKILNRLKKAVLNKEITEKRIDESLMRILKLKSFLSG